MQRKAVIGVALGTGFALWLVPALARGVEPWDASFGMYCLVMFLGGGACMVLAVPARASDIVRWPWYMVLGQIAFMLFQPDRWSLWPLALIALVVLSVPAVAGAALSWFWLAQRPGKSA